MPQSLASHLPPSSRAIAAFKEDGDVHPDLRCPITHEALQHPVRVGQAGAHLYSENALVTWVRRNPVDPMTRRSLCGQVLIREPTATAAINALRRGAADICLEEGDAPRALALSREAADCEAVDAQRPVAQLPRRWAPGGFYLRTAILACRVGCGAAAVGSLGLAVYGSWQGFDLERSQQAYFAGITAGSFAMALRDDPRAYPIAMAAGHWSTVGIRLMMPRNTHLWGAMIGVAVAAW